VWIQRRRYSVLHVHVRLGRRTVARRCLVVDGEKECWCYTSTLRTNVSIGNLERRLGGNDVWKGTTFVFEADRNAG
jgi:hypothetical protein